MSSRSYWVGLPVGVTVHDDGTVDVEVDMSEASSAMSDEFHERGEDLEGTSEDQMLLDCAVVDGERPDHANKPVTRMGSVHLQLMKCPVRYRCGFKTRDLEEMARHIEAFDHSKS